MWTAKQKNWIWAKKSEMSIKAFSVNVALVMWCGIRLAFSCRQAGRSLWGLSVSGGTVLVWCCHWEVLSTSQNFQIQLAPCLKEQNLSSSSAQAQSRCSSQMTSPFHWWSGKWKWKVPGRGMRIYLLLIVWSPSLWDVSSQESHQLHSFHL